VEINGEPARGISHTRAIELIQAGGNKVVLLLRPGAGLAQEGSEYCIHTVYAMRKSMCNTGISSRMLVYH